MNNTSSFEIHIKRMQVAQNALYERHGVDDIYTSSKVYEILIASNLGHDLIPGQSGTSDATDELTGKLRFEYKHYKETSSNHSWTFNDFSDGTITKLRTHVNNVFFCHIEDTNYPPYLDWYYNLSGRQIADYLAAKTPAIKNSRKMINISRNQIENYFSNVRNSNVQIQRINKTNPFPGKYGKELELIFESINELEKAFSLKNLLTSSKLWELVVAQKLGHFVNSEQGGRSGAHDARDIHGKWYEYKVDKSIGWSFQDISNSVLKKYEEVEAFILAVVDKPKFNVEQIYKAPSASVVSFLTEKRDKKAEAYRKQGKEVRRHQVSIGKSELDLVKAQRIL